MKKIILKSPLFTSWSEQYVRIYIPETIPGQPLCLTVSGKQIPFQYTGEKNHSGAEILLKLSFQKDEVKTLVFSPADKCSSVLDSVKLPFDGCPIGSLVGFDNNSHIQCDLAPEDSSLTKLRDGLLFTDYEIIYNFTQNRHYTINYRVYKLDPYIEVHESFSLGYGSKLTWNLNQHRQFTHILCGDSFEGESQPQLAPLGEPRPDDILCRLQMPVLTEYFIPKNHGWFAFVNQEKGNMLGIMGLYGALWENPSENMPIITDKNSDIEWTASLASGTRHWLIYRGPFEREYTAEKRLVFHRLHAEFNALRLDEHFDLTGDDIYDDQCWQESGIFAQGDFRKLVLQRLNEIPALKKQRDTGDIYSKLFSALVEPSEQKHVELFNLLIQRFELWVKQFQGWRQSKGDYAKNVIGFSRYLRALLIAYELLRRDNALDHKQLGKLNAYFAFAARRITDEGRWPHSRTWKHPDHPESSRDIYTYGGEHKPDRLVWSNSLPNFQSDPLCALAHLSAIFKGHSDGEKWKQMAISDIERNLSAYAGNSGAWEESINYALYTFSYFVITFKVIKERFHIDYFNDERVRNFARWLCHFFGPFDKRFEAYTWPGIGNSLVPQAQTHYLLAYASLLADNDPLKNDCLAIYQMTENQIEPEEHWGIVLAAMAPILDEKYSLSRLHSEWMDEVGVSMRHKHLEKKESYLFQKIGFSKDHYECDETAFNWYAKGTPLCMDYGTYTGDVGVAGAHNLVEIPDSDHIRRGYLADHLFTPMVDYTHCEVPVTLKLARGHMSDFSEVDANQNDYKYFYIGDKNPVGPKTWKVRLMLYVKPDYVAIFDRIYGSVPHRYNLHTVGDEVLQNGKYITVSGRFDLDLLSYVQHPDKFKIESGLLVPHDNPSKYIKHSQSYFRLYNQQDGIYRTLLFAKEKQRQVNICSVADGGIKIETSEYTDYIFINNETATEKCHEVNFTGCVGWIRKDKNGIYACVPDGELLCAFGKHFEGRGPWSYNIETQGGIKIYHGPPRLIKS